MSDRLTVVVPDATRPLDYADVLTPLLEQYSDQRLTVLVALGLHRPMTSDELRPLRSVCASFDATLVQHDAETTIGGFAPQVVDCDRIINVGVVEPHQYAGFSGGVKGVAIGCASSDIIAEMHSLPMLRDCGARVGWLEGNPFQDKLWDLVVGLPPITGLYLVPGFDDVFVGEARSAFDAAVTTARTLHFRHVEPVDSMLLRVPEPKAVNFYQASRAATYVALATSSAIRDGGTLYVEAECPEGVGEGAGEEACAAAMQKGVETLLRELRSPEPPVTRGGEQRAYVLAMALERCDIVLTGADRAIPELAAVGIEQIDSAPEVELVVDDPFHAVPVAASPGR